MDGKTNANTIVFTNTNEGETRRLRSVEYGGRGGPHTDTPWNSRIDHDRLGMPTWNGGRRAIQLI